MCAFAYACVCTCVCVRTQYECEYERSGVHAFACKRNELTDGRTDKPSYRDARTHLKTCSGPAIEALPAASKALSGVSKALPVNCYIAMANLPFLRRISSKSFRQKPTECRFHRFLRHSRFLANRNFPEQKTMEFSSFFESDK